MVEINSYQKNQELMGEVVDLTHEGMGVVKLEGYPFFVEGSLTGEKIKFKATKVGKKYGYGKLMELLTESPDRVAMTDDIGRLTGTMTLQHLSYEGQLQFKKKQVKDAFERIGQFQEVVVQNTLRMKNPWQYRNKAQIPVREINGRLETGFYRKNSHELIPVENYYIQDPVIDQTILKVRDILRDYQLTAYDEHTHTGLLRHIIVKRGHHTGQIMIVLVTNGKKIPHLDEIVERLQHEIPEMVSLIQNINQQKTNVILGRQSYCLWGQPYYQDQMLGLTFNISAQSFYQVNTPQAERMYQLALDLADLQGGETVLDAYCGIGTITLALAKKAEHVYAMEIVPEAIEMARDNAELNQIENAHFEVGKAEDWLPRWNEAGIHFDIVVVDPPRKGLDVSFVEALIEQAPPKIVYISCNPSTQARDCRLLADAGYQLKYIQPVDLFGQTSHVETVCLMSRK